MELTTKQERAAALVAENELTDEAVAAEIGINRRTLQRWRDDPQFCARIGEYSGMIRATVAEKSISAVASRVARKQSDWDRLEAVRAARAAAAQNDPEWLANGGATGLMIRRRRTLGAGVVVTDYLIDTAYLTERLRLEEATAKELGQHVERHEIETRDTGIAEALDAKIETLARRLAA